MILLALLLLLGFIGYHLATWLGSRTAQHQLPEGYPQEQLPLISFLVPAWEAAGDLPRFLMAFEKLDYPNTELLLCVGGDDGSLDIARAHQNGRVRVLEQERGEGKQRALRRLYPLARGELILLTDIDCEPVDAAIAPLVGRVIAGAQAATGSIRPLPWQEENPFVRVQWAVERLNALRSSDTTFGLRGASALVTREAIETTGAFAQEAPSGTDYTLAKELGRHGIEIAFSQTSEMPTRFPGNASTYIRKQARWLRNVVVLGARYGAWNEVRSVVITLALPFILALMLVLGAVMPIFLLLAALLIAHAALNRLRYAYVSGVRTSALSTLSTIFADLGAGLLATSQILRRRLTWS